MPTRQLPANPSLAQLKAQAKELLRAQRERLPQAIQRLREFHPRFAGAAENAIAAAPLQLSDAQLSIAREYGFSSWPRLKEHVEDSHRENLALPHHLRIKDGAFKRALELLDAGDADGLRNHLRAHPAVATQRVTFEGGNYFRDPALLEFIAENPTRHGRVPKNAVELAQAILDAGGKNDRSSVNSALELIASSAAARESGVQLALIELLCDYGANPNAGTNAAALYGEFDAVRALLKRGAKMDLSVAAALGDGAEARRSLPFSDDETKQKALAMAAQWGHAEIVELLLDAGEDPNRFTPVGGHSHATPLHQAALAGHLRIAQLLVERGARTDLRDIHYEATPLGWAEYAGHTDVVNYLIEFAQFPR